MMKWNYKSWNVLTLGLMLFLSACQNPLEDFDLLVSGEVIKNSQTIEVLDTNGDPVTNVTVRLLSGDIEDIYNMNGYKNFSIAGSMITFGLDPNRDLSGDDVVRFQVELAGDDYLAQIIPVEISTASTGIQQLKMMKVADLPSSVEITTEVVAISGGTVPVATPIAASGSTGSEVNVTLAAGTQLRDANGNVVSGGSLQAKVMAVDPEDPQALALFPGGSFTVSEVLTESGSAAAGVFNTGAFTTINMSVGNTPVTQFSEPIKVEMNLSPNFTLSSGAPIVPGVTQLAVYSISANQPTWTFQGFVTVDAGGKVVFETNHLSTFMVGEFVSGCDQPAVINFNAGWISAGTSFPFGVEVHWQGKVISTHLVSLNDNVRSINLKNMPAGATLTVRNNITGAAVLSNSNVAACGTATALTIPAQVIEDKVTLQLYVRCPGRENVITVLPTFQLYYRVHGTQQFKFLGTVTSGFLQTNILKSDGTRYDFQAVWGDRVKVVNDHTVTTSNVGTVGTDPGDIIGEHAGANNLSILTEECNRL